MRKGRSAMQVTVADMMAAREARAQMQETRLAGRPGAGLSAGGSYLDNLATWVKSGAECYGMGSLLTKGTADEIAANAAQVRKIIDETRASM